MKRSNLGGELSISIRRLEINMLDDMKFNAIVENKIKHTVGL
jgi:hypothetical protein